MNSPPARPSTPPRGTAASAAKQLEGPVRSKRRPRLTRGIGTRNVTDELNTAAGVNTEMPGGRRRRRRKSKRKSHKKSHKKKRSTKRRRKSRKKKTKRRRRR